MPINRPKPLFKVASEFNVSTQSIVDTLEDNGFSAANRPNFKITPEMYEVLDGVYGEDKAKSQDHERAKEEYESRRNHMMNQRNESVTLDNILEPLDGLEPIDEKAEPSIEDDLVAGLEPLEEETEEVAESETAEEPEEASEPEVEEQEEEVVAEEQEEEPDPEVEEEEVVAEQPEDSEEEDGDDEEEDDETEDSDEDDDEDEDEEEDETDDSNDDDEEDQEKIIRVDVQSNLKELKF